MSPVPRRRSRSTGALAMVCLLAGILVGCGDSSDDGADTGAGADPTVTSTGEAAATPDTGDDGDDDESAPDADGSEGSQEAVDEPASPIGSTSVPAGEGRDDPFVAIADLDAAQVVPGPGRPDTIGRFELVIEADQICAAATVSVPVAAAPGATLIVAIGAAGEQGPVEFDLGAPTDPDGGLPWDSCRPAEPALVDRFRSSTDAFYAEVRTATYPDGAARGQWTGASLFDLTLGGTRP